MIANTPRSRSSSHAAPNGTGSLRVPWPIGAPTATGSAARRSRIAASAASAGSGTPVGGFASVQRVSDIINEITAASSEQSDGIGQINKAVAQLDQMTQQNAALVEQSAAAAESLQGQTVKLASLVAVFKLGSGQYALA